MSALENPQGENNRDIDKRLTYLKMDSDTIEYLKRTKEIVENELPTALDKFYEVVRNTPETAKFFSSSDHMTSAKNAQLGHWAKIVTGQFDSEYAKNVTKIGSVHAQIGLRPRWYIGGYALIIEHLIHAFLKENWPKKSLFGKGESYEETASQLSALLKAVMLDMDLSISVYIDQAEAAKKKAQEQAIAQERQLVTESLGKAMNEIAKNNLTYRITDDMPEAYADLVADFNTTFEELAATMESIRGAAGQINTGSHEIQAAADDLSKRAEQQAAAVEETAAAVEEISSAVKASAERAQTTGQLVENARKDAEHSGEVVQNTVVAMERIAKSSEDISRIIGVIDEIAFQTNLLALNAGVEAARAGDAGKGFAVVAQEVRELAQRSANAAKEIKQLILASGNEVQYGVTQVSETGNVLQKIVDAVRDISGNMASIVDSAREQSEGLQEINMAVNSVDKGTQQNAAMSEELTASSHSLAVEVGEINSMLSQFHTGGETVAPASVPRNTSTPIASPANELKQKVANAFVGNAALDTDDWDEF